MKNIFTILTILLSLSVFGQEPFKIDDCLQLKGIVKKNAKIYADPDLSSHDRAFAEKFTVLYMFKHEGTSSPIKNKFYHVGKSQDTPSGYIHEDNIVQWNHRLCVTFTDLVGSRSPALVYKTLKEAQQEDWDSNKKPNKKAIGQEPTGKTDKKYDMLLPVLEETSVDKKGSNRENMKAFKVAFLGETGKSSGIKKPVYKGKSKLDLMFLIDATGSMAGEIVGTKKVLKNLVNKMKSMENTEVRIGISLYKDYGEDFVAEKWQSLTTDYKQVLKRLSEVEVSQGGDTEEAMYQGVSQTISATNWSKGDNSPVLREILIIGDAPGHEYGGDYKEDASDLITKASEERVRFIAMNVGSDAKLGKQLGDLSEGLKDGDQGLYIEASAVVGDMSDDYLNSLSSAITQEIKRLKELEGVRSGITKLEDVTPINRAIFLKNLPSSGFDDIGIHFNEGWITEKNSKGLRQVEPFVFMTYGDLNKYKFFCQAAIAVAQSESADAGIIDLTTSKITALSGETYDPGMELDEHLRKTLCLPSSNSGILKYSLTEISRWSPLRKEKFILSIEDKVKLLDQIQRDNSQWRKPSGTDLKYTFVKLELMP